MVIVNKGEFGGFEMKKRPTTIELFCGAGGMSEGFRQAGFEILIANDNWDAALETYKANHPKTKVIHGDIRDKTIKGEIIGTAKGRRVDIIIGGPPCQSFSKSGLRKGIQDPRGTLFQDFIDVIREVKPRVFLMENVRGLYSANNGKAFKTIMNEFDKTGYTVSYEILDAADYGVPQFRQRLFLIGYRNGKKFKFPLPTHGTSGQSRISGKEVLKMKPFVTVQDSIGSMNEKGQPLTGRYAHLLSDIPEGMNYSHFTKERGYKKPIFKWRSKFWYFLLKIDRKRPSLTIQANPGLNTGPFHWENRRLTINEIKRLQSFPDNYNIVGGNGSAWRQVGNAVPPLLAKVLAEEIKKQLL